MCLWDQSRRRCTDVFGHEGSITKVSEIDKSVDIMISCVGQYQQRLNTSYIFLVVLSIQVISDESSDTALSLGYDGTICVWNFSDASSQQHLPPSVQRRHRGTSTAPTYSPLSILAGHNSPVLEGTYVSAGRRIIATGAKDGSLFMWDADSGAILAR